MQLPVSELHLGVFVWAWNTYLFCCCSLQKRLAHKGNWFQKCNKHWTWRCFAENQVNSFHCCFTDLSAMSEKWLLFPQTYQQLVYLLCSQLFFCYIVLSCTMINLILLLNIIFFCSVNTPNTQVSHLPLRINRNWSIFVEILNTRSLFSFLMKMFMKGFHEQHHALDFQAACVSIASTSLILLIG